MNWKIIILAISLLTLSVISCSTKNINHWRKMDCGLYMSPAGDIGFPSYPELANIDHSKLKGEECPNYFLTTFGYDDTTQLKYVVDTLTFQQISSNLYRDTNNIYNYNPMCDGGYFNLTDMEISKFRLLNNQYYIYDKSIFHTQKGLIDGDYNTFGTSYKHKEMACDKNSFYSYGEKFTEIEFIDNYDEELLKDLKYLQQINDYSYINIDTHFFSTGSMLYWQWDRDSSWMTFEKKDKSKKVLMQLESGLMAYTGRLGLCFLKEYDDFIHFQYRHISGCCSPPDMVFLNKNTGEEINRIFDVDFIWHSWEDDYLIYFSDSSYNEIEYFNLKNNTKRKTNTMVGSESNTLNLNIEYYPYDVFNLPPFVEKNHLLLEYKYEHPHFNDSLLTDVLKIYK